MGFGIGERQRSRSVDQGITGSATLRNAMPSIISDARVSTRVNEYRIFFRPTNEHAAAKRIGPKPAKQAKSPAHFALHSLKYNGLVTRRRIANVSPASAIILGCSTVVLTRERVHLSSSFLVLIIFLCWHNLKFGLESNGSTDALEWSG